MTAVTALGDGLPLRGGTVHRSTRADVLRDRMAEVAVGHEVTPLRGRLDGVATGVRLGAVDLAFVRYGAPTRVVAEPTGEMVCWTLPLGPMRADWGSGRDSLCGEGFVLGRERRTTMFPEPFRGAVVITAPERALVDQLARLTGSSTPRPEIRPGPLVGRGRGVLDAAWRYATATLAAAPSPPPPGLVRSLEESLLTSLLLELPLQRMEDFSAAAISPAHAHVRRAETWARGHLDAPIRLDHWADAVGVSVRHLQKCFVTVHGCSPLAHLQRLRLEEAHRMLRAHPELPVSMIATACGFTHLGRFAGLYRKAYGVPPSQGRAAVQ